MNNDNFEYCILDADSLIYQIAHTEPSPNLCKKKFDDRIAEIISNTDALGSYVFIKGETNFRHSYPTYKANRKDNIDPAVKERIKKLYTHAKEFCVEADGAEADDYVRLAAVGCAEKNLSFIVAHIDKDLNCIPGWHYNFRTGTSTQILPVEAYTFQMQQLLMGDSTDNIGGIRGVGIARAEKILKDIPPERMLSEVISIWQNKVGRMWKCEFTECANLIYMRESSDDLRVLSFEELEERFAWKTTDIGSPSVSDQQEHLGSSTLSSDQPEDSTSEESS